MNKIELLFIRACKSKNPEKRVVSVYKRFYYRIEEPMRNKYICYILSKTYNKYGSKDSLRIIEALSPDKYGNNGITFWERVLCFYISEIRLMEITMFPEYIPPLYFRRMK